MPEEEDKILAKFVIKSGWATEPQVKECWRIQNEYRQSGEMPPSLADILVEREYISPSQKESIKKKIGKKGPRMFGQIALSMGMVSQDQLKEALDIQTRMRQNQRNFDGFSSQIGEIMVSKNYFEQKQLDTILKAQRQEAEGKQISICKHCGTQFNAKLIAQGVKLKCGKCGKTLEAAQAKFNERVNDTIIRSEPYVEQSLRRPKKKKIALTLSLPQLRKRKRKVNIPGYQILDILGEDAISTTYKACYTLDKAKIVVLKLYNKDASSDREFVAKIERYVKHSAALNIPNLRKNFGTGSFREKKGHSLHYIVSEFIEGDSLRQLLEQKVEITVEKGTKIISRLARILQYVWQEGMCHGNIAPNNVLISSEGKVILLNMGVPCKVDKNIIRIVEQDGIAPLYIAPETTDNQPPDCYSDLYSLGALLYHLLAKKPAFEGTSSFDSMNRLTEAIGVPPISMYNPDVSPKLFAILEKMMAPEPEERYRDYLELIAELKAPEPLECVQALPVTEIEEEEMPKKEESVRLRPSQSAKSQVPWVRIIFFSIVFGLLGWYMYSSSEHTKEIQGAKKKYFALRKEYMKNKNSPSQRAMLKKKFKMYIQKYKHVAFDDEKANTVKSAKKNLQDLELMEEKVNSGQWNAFRNKAINILGNKYKTWAALKELEKIPDYLAKVKQDAINQYRCDCLGKAASISVTMTKQVSELISKIEADNDYQNYQKNNGDFKKCLNDMQRYLGLFVAQGTIEELKQTLGSPKAKDILQLPLAMKLKENIAGFSDKLGEMPGISAEEAKILLCLLYQKMDAKLLVAKEKFASYRAGYEQKISEKDRLVFNKAVSAMEKYQKEYDYPHASTAIKLALQNVISENYKKQLQDMQLKLTRLSAAKQALIKKLRSPKSDQLKIMFQNRMYSIDSASASAITLLKPKRGNRQEKKIPLAWSEFPKNQFPVLVEFSRQNMKDDDLFALSSFCVEHGEYILAHDILKDIVSQHEEAKSYLEEITRDLKEKSQKLLSILQNADLKDERKWKIYASSALDLKNRYLVPGITYTPESELILKNFFRKIFREMFGKKSEPNLFCDFSNSDQLERKLKGLKFQKPFGKKNFKIENGYMSYKTNCSFSGKNIRGVCGLCRFTTASQKFTVEFGPYDFVISNDGKDARCVNKKGKTEQVSIDAFGAGKWVLFGLFISENEIRWYLNSRRIYSLSHEGKSIGKISFRTSKEMQIDNLYIGNRSKK